jgi:gamma-glutamyltranspeptidase/glutathione hydrolase
MFVSGTARGAVAAGHPATTQAAAEVLAEGGNAFDAVVAAALTACVVEPAFASLGGGGLMLAQTAGRTPALFDFFADTPRLRQHNPDLPLDWVTAMSPTGQPLCGGLASVATPGTVAGLWAIHEKLGRMPLRDLAAQAITQAKDGHPVRPLQARALAMIAPLLTAPGQRATPFTKAAPVESAAEAPALNTPPARKVLDSDDRLVNHDLAKLIEALVIEGPDLFYKGEVAERLVIDCAARGGHLQREDLAFYAVRERTALSFPYRDSLVFTAPDPSLSGLQMQHTLALLEGNIVPSRGWGSDHHWGLIADALALTHQQVEAATRPEDGLSQQRLMEPKALTQARKTLTGPPIVRRGSTQISVVDQAGNMAALTLTNGEASGRLIPGCGVLLNNFLASLERGPDERPWWIGRQRLGSLLAPTLLHCRDGRRMALGAGGSSRIRSALVQTLVNLLDFALPPDQAIIKPRLHVLGQEDDAILGAEHDLPDALKRRWPRHRTLPDIDMYFGGVHLAEWRPSGPLTAAADPRRDGVALLG